MGGDASQGDVSDWCLLSASDIDEPLVLNRFKQCTLWWCCACTAVMEVVQQTVSMVVFTCSPKTTLCGISSHLVTHPLVRYKNLDDQQ